jgi:hypothetical protein
LGFHFYFSTTVIPLLLFWPFLSRLPTILLAGRDLDVDLGDLGSEASAGKPIGNLLRRFAVTSASDSRFDFSFSLPSELTAIGRA